MGMIEYLYPVGHCLHPKNEIISWRYLCIGIFQSHRERLVVEYIYWQQWKLLFTILY